MRRWLLRVGEGIAVAVVQLNVGHADGGHLARSVGQAPPGAVLVVVGGLAVDDSYKAGLGLLGADDTGVRQSGAQLFTVGGVQVSTVLSPSAPVTVKVN